ncbi:hypothetical protein EV426DRAFT_644207 [Tirmania nivea]|nr:hypothetical protein EV426DRAFT_644207 [Tirmania nivea]
MATLKDAVTPAVGYTPFKRTAAPSLAEILDIYPVMEAIASRLNSDDLLSLSLVSKDIHQALGQSTTKSYWKHLLSKCLPLLCYAGDHGQACSEVQRCLRCKAGVCSTSTNALLLLCDSAERRIRYVCKGCILTGRNAILSDCPTLFGAHTINQLTAGRKWMRENQSYFQQDDYIELKETQEADVTFCPNRMDLFDMRCLPSINYPPPPNQNQDQQQSEPVDRKIVAWQIIRRQSAYNPKLDRIRGFEQSRCMCLQAGLSLPLCYNCYAIGFCNDWKYISFARQNTGCCECGTMVVDFPGEKEGEIIPGAIWNPQKDTLAGARGQPTSTATGTDGRENGTSPPGETIEGLCGWCGFRIYQQKGKKMHFPATNSEWLAYEQKRNQAAP